MKELFKQDGHLTDEGLSRLVNGEELDELSRLEIAEHLSFCDECVSRYSQLLLPEEYAAPPVPLYGSIMKKIRERARRIFLSRAATVSTAACLTLVFWWGGIFTFPVTKMNEQKDTENRPKPQVVQTIPEDVQPTQGLGSAMQEWTNDFSKWTQDLFEPLGKVFTKSYDKENSNGEK